SPDLVILDICLGDQAVGYQILQGMRQDDELMSTPVIICTADTSFVRENRDVVDALNADILEKPFDLEVLEEKVSLALSGQVVKTGEADPVS
ncbi:MAG: response regulator, partial [Thermomicrobiaceae bacterium]